jgi:hypothetical protein
VLAAKNGSGELMTINVTNCDDGVGDEDVESFSDDEFAFLGGDARGDDVISGDDEELDNATSFVARPPRSPSFAISLQHPSLDQRNFSKQKIEVLLAERHRLQGQVANAIERASEPSHPCHCCVWQPDPVGRCRCALNSPHSDVEIGHCIAPFCRTTKLLNSCES